MNSKMNQIVAFFVLFFLSLIPLLMFSEERYGSQSAIDFSLSFILSLNINMKIGLRD